MKNAAFCFLCPEILESIGTLSALISASCQRPRLEATQLKVARKYKNIDQFDLKIEIIGWGKPQSSSCFLRTQSMELLL